MENGKKKRNKKKKTKPTITTEDDTILSESTSVDDNHMRNGQSDPNPVSDTLDLSSQQIGEMKDTALEETIEHLRRENFLLAHNQAKLEDTVKNLQEENHSHIQNKADLELKLVQFDGEKHSWLQQEAQLKEKIRQLKEEKTALDLEVARLLETIDYLEREKSSLIISENSSRKTIVDQSNSISRLQAQVVELEESKHDLLRENKQLMENIADCQSKVLNLEKRISPTYLSDQVTKEVLSSQVDAARILVDKLITENADLIGKVNELFVELQRVPKTEPSSAMDSKQIIGVSEATSFDNSISPLIQDASGSGQKLEARESVPIHNHDIAYSAVELYDDSLPPKSLISIEAGEIVQIPLRGNEGKGRELPVVDRDEGDVGLSDSPLIGAPYRLITFMAKYVSGADLVGKS